MIFPLATLTFATFQLEIYTGFVFFRVCSWIFGLGVVLGAVIVHVMTYVMIVNAVVQIV